MELQLESELLAQSLVDENQFYTRAGDHRDRLLKSFRAGKEPGETTYYQHLDDILTLRMGFLYCFTGWPGGGKTEFLTQLSVLQSYMKQRKVAFYSPESYPIDEYIDSFIHCYLGKTTDKRFGHVCSESEYAEAIQWVNEYYYFCESEETPDCPTLLRWFDHLYTLGCRIFVVDPFNSINSEGEDRNIAVALKRNLTAFKRFAAQKRCMVLLVEHPKTPTDPKEFDQVPTNRNLFGGTMWWNKIDVGVTVHRPNREDKHDRTVLIKTWKVKKQQLNGRPGEGFLYFDVKTNRYYTTQHCIDHPMIMPDLYAEKEQQPF